MVPLIQTDPLVMEPYLMTENNIQYILIKKDNNLESYYGPFNRMSDAYDWANKELQKSKISEYRLCVKQIYVPYLKKET